MEVGLEDAQTYYAPRCTIATVESFDGQVAT